MKKQSAILLSAITLASLAGSLAVAEDLPSVLGDTAGTSSATTTSSSSTSTSDTAAPSASTSTDTSSSSNYSVTSTTSTTPATSTTSSTTTTKAFEDFKDVGVDHPYYNAIIVERYQGLLKGYPDNTFHPDQPLNRVEALKLIFEASEMQLNTGIAPASFADTDETAWYSGYLNKAVYMEIVNGYSDNTFRPNNPVNLVEFLKMLEVAQKVDLSNVNLPQIPFADTIPGTWYAKYINFAKINDLITADAANKVYPDAALTRGRAADIIYRFRNWKSRVSTSTTSTTSTSSTSPSSSVIPLKDFALYVSDSYKFAIQYPKIWFYSSLDNADSTVIRTYGFGPKDLATNPPAVKLELLPDDKNFVTNQVYNNFSYFRVDGADNTIVLSAKINGSTRIYRLTGAADQEANLLNMMVSLTSNITGLSSYNPAADTSATSTSDTSSTSSTSTDATTQPAP